MKYIFSLLLFLSHIIPMTFPMDSNNLVYFQFKDSSVPPNLRQASPFYESESNSKTLIFQYTRINRRFSFSSMKHYLLNGKLIESCSKKDSRILSIKTYWKHMGYLPLFEYQKELQKAQTNKYYTPNLADTRKLIGFLFFRQEIRGTPKVQIKNQLISICTLCKNSKNEENVQFFLVDRKANAEFPQVWNTKIRVIYLGRGKNCGKFDKSWVENYDKALNLVDESYFLMRRYTINMVLKDIKEYLMQFPKYNVLYNSQHFANYLLNRVTGKRLSFKEKTGKNNFFQSPIK